MGRSTRSVNYSNAGAKAGVIPAWWEAIRNVQVQMVMRQELRTQVMYDIEDDRVRYRVSEVCLDFGLERIQFSVFRGKLNRNKREELASEADREAGRRSGQDPDPADARMISNPRWNW